MLNRYDWKNIVKRIIIGVGIAFILFNINKCNAKALVIKDYIYSPNVNDNQITGTYSIGSEHWKDIVMSNYIDLSNYTHYDYAVFRIRELNFTINSSTLVDNDLAHYCTYWAVDTQGNNSNYKCNAWASDTLQSYIYAPIDTSFSTYLQDKNGYGSTCFYDNTLKDHIICPFNSGFDWSSVWKMTFIMNSASPAGSSASARYTFRIDKTIYFANADSTDIINGLSGIQTQQQQTNDIITNSDTTSSSNSANTGLNSMNSQLTQQVDSLASVNTYNNIVNNFFTQINNSTCSPISLPMPFVQGKNIVLPCIGTEIQNSAPALWTFWRFMCAGIIGFALWGNFIAFIKGVVDPYNIGANNLPIGGGK